MRSDTARLDTGRPAFVLNMDANGLGVSRSLGWHGIKVVGADFRQSVPGLRSRYVRPLLTPNPVKEPEAMVEILQGAASEMGQRPVLVACSDAYVLLVSRHRQALAKHFDFSTPPERVVESMVNKRMQYELAERSGIPIPRTSFPRSLSELDEVKGDLTYPAFIKPLYSHLWYSRFGNKGFIVNDFRELRAHMATAFEAGLEAIVQAIVGEPGKDLFQVCAHIDRQGRSSPPFVWRKARQSPPNFGVASLAVSEHNDRVKDLGQRFLESISYRGIGSAEFKYDPEADLYRLIELNCRTWMQNVMCTVAGLNLPLIQYADLTDQTLPSVDGFRDGVRWWDALADLDSFIRMRRRGELSTSAWMRSWLGCDCQAFYSRGDLRPVLKRMGGGVEVMKTLVHALRRETDEDAKATSHRK